MKFNELSLEWQNKAIKRCKEMYKEESDECIMEYLKDKEDFKLVEDEENPGFFELEF